MRPQRTRTPVVTVLTALLTVGLLASATPSTAADPHERKREVDRGITDLEHQLEGTSAELQAAFAALQASQARLPVAQAELAEAEKVRAEAQRKDAELAGRLAAAEQSQALAEEAIAEGGAAIADTESTIGQIASQAYRRGGMAPELSIALNARSPEEFANRYLLVDAALRSQNGALARLHEQQALRAHAEARLAAVEDEVAWLRAEAAANLEVARQAEAEAVARQKEIEQLIAQQAQAKAQIEARKVAEEARLDQLEAERKALEAELARLAEIARREAAAREAAERAAAERASRSRAQAPAPSSDGPLLRPVGGRITSDYGYRVHPIYGTRRLHAGTDFGSGCGTPVKAAASGSVVRAGRNGGYGNQIVVNHGAIGGDGVATSYNHLSRYARTGGSVSRGEVIGYVGTTGSSTGCHLHFEVYVNGSTQNPMRWL